MTHAEQMKRYDDVLAMCDAYSGRVRVLADTLAAANVALPVTSELVDKLVAADILDGRSEYDDCAEVMDDNDMAAVWSIIKEVV